MNLQFDRALAGKIAVAVGVGVGAYVLYRTFRKRNVPEHWVQVGTISEIFIYPIKSCKGRSVAEAECLGLGLKHGEYLDRRFVVADTDGKFLTARDAPKMILIEPKLENGILTLLAPSRDPTQVELDKVVARGNVARVTLWEDMPVDAFDCGDEVANWISDYLGRVRQSDHYRLYYHTPGLFNSRSLNNYDRFRGLFGRRKDLAIFPDLTPYMLMTESSMDDLNNRTPNGEQFSIRNFRPNFVVAGTKQYDEDKWAKVRIGDLASFTNIKACTRCLLTTIDWTTGVKHPRSEPLRTLRGYRVSRKAEEKKYYGASPMLGINLAIDRLGLVRVGDPVYVTYKSG